MRITFIVIHGPLPAPLVLVASAVDRGEPGRQTTPLIQIVEYRYPSHISEFGGSLASLTTLLFQVVSGIESSWISGV